MWIIQRTVFPNCFRANYLYDAHHLKYFSNSYKLGHNHNIVNYHPNQEINLLDFYHAFHRLHSNTYRCPIMSFIGKQSNPELSIAFSLTSMTSVPEYYRPFYTTSVNLNLVLHMDLRQEHHWNDATSFSSPAIRWWIILFVSLLMFTQIY